MRKLLAEVGGADGHSGIPCGIDPACRFGNLKRVFTSCFQAFRERFQRLQHALISAATIPNFTRV